MKHRIIIIGAGGHGKAVFETILAQNKFEITGFADASITIGTIIIPGYKVIASLNNLDSLRTLADYFIVAIGNNKIRKQLYDSLKQHMEPATIIHPSATISPTATIGKGNVVLSGAIINTHVSTGENTIINSGAIIDHDCKIGSHIHLAIGTIVGSNTDIGSDFTTEIGDRIKSFSKIS